MDNQSELHNNQEFIQELRDCATQLSEKLSSDDLEGASDLIQKLLEVRDRNMFNAVGKLTRGLHSAIVNFHVDGDLSSEPPEIESSEIQDASDRLNYVIEMTQNAADKTMDMVEASAPIAINLGEEASALHEQWGRLRRREMTADEFREVYKRMDSFLGDMREGTGELNKNLQDIILEQGFQDLTGQVLKRVIGLIREVEESLVSLVRIAGQVEEITGLADAADTKPEAAEKPKQVAAEGPQIHAAEREDVVSGQDDVDDLLSSLGF
ncbi:protein phosphatase CheZ [Pseudomaricurvus alkylphenolicus]|uniref:protein phosphatase CheZ n=1 Tax=Pseudomaricurvus alkylphenolicus TaxID=1306991 RepID=UPI001422AC5A|nr:protein phosphatase CheZ [Pseudomaricurvus alkylphenolicus]NIB43186.1 protein phosphatase CheZ [Pseudomaricurvus alkylphenolicus]